MRKNGGSRTDTLCWEVLDKLHRLLRFVDWLVKNKTLID